MIKISNAALKHFAKLLVDQETGTQIRVFVVNPGTFNAECGISYCPKDSIEKTDTALKFGKIIVYIDKLSLPYLKDAEIDLINDQFGSQLTLKAPNAKISKVDNNAPLEKRVEYLLQSQINQQLAIHGGYISLVEITEDGYVYLKFSGGCNGCAMANNTLQEKIKKKLLKEFPELKGVYDVTEHKHDEYSYY